MTGKQVLDAFSETLMYDDRILNPRERELLTSLLQNARATCGEKPEIHAAVAAAIACAVGETVAQRAFAVLGSSILGRMLGAPGPSARIDAPSVTDASSDLAAPRPTKGPEPARPKKGPGPPHRPPVSTPGHRRPPKGPGPPHGQLEPARTVALRDQPELLVANCVVLDEFLAPQEVADLTHYVLEHESDFGASEVLSPANESAIDYDCRRSRVLMDLGKHHDILVNRMLSVLPAVREKLGMADFAITDIEAQITASNDGDFFRDHSDNGTEKIAPRYLTYVYFFHREPRAFEGGELRIHDSRLEDGVSVRAGSYRVIEPQQNQIVFFPSSMLHEITPVDCPSRAFTDSRFTVNGWFHR